jgi:S1-C subfamily serine protease
VRVPAVAALAFLSAALGAGAALAVAAGTGWIGSSSKTVVVNQSQQPAPSPTKNETSPLPRRFDPERIYADRTPGVVTIFSSFSDGSLAQGSGFVVSRAGAILTDAHVITSAPNQPVVAATNVYVEFSDGDRIQGRIVGWDVFNDVGVVKVDPARHAIEPLPLGRSSSVVVGEPVAAIGSPFGNENSLSVGVVSGVRRSISSVTSEYQVVDAIQTDAAINHGNSGGPLLDARGRVIGINAQIRSSTGANEGVGFAVPIDTARRSMGELIRHGHVSYAYVGITTDDLTPVVAQHFHYASNFGALIACVKPGSPGAVAGLRGGSHRQLFQGNVVTAGGDLIVAIDGHTVHNGSDVVNLVGNRLNPGQKTVFTILRGTQRRNVTVKLGVRPTTPAPGCGG